ncbi:MAG: GNAT family N-acetyltransferase [Solirubrobacterales bacterium]
MKIAFRCDGDLRVGAGHVARSLEIAKAFARAGHEPLFLGCYAGLASDLVAAAGFANGLPGPGATGAPPGADAVVVDSYEIGAEELGRLADRLPVAVVNDEHEIPAPVTAVLNYHVPPPGHPRALPPVVQILGPDYAPVSPRLAAARHERGLAHALVTFGGSERARALVEPATEALGSLGELEVFISGSGAVPDVGLVERINWADVAISAAGTTAYELACAGVPTVAAAIVDNQQVVAGGLQRAGAVRRFDARPGDFRRRLVAELAALASAAERERLAIRGPEVVDGHGAARARDALLCAFAGRRLPRVLRYRPARAEDAAQLLAWRTDPHVRAASRNSGEIDSSEHLRWLDGVLSDLDRVLLIAQREGEPVGSLRFDRAEGRAEISVSIAAEHRGDGLGTQAIREASELFLAANPGVRAVVAHVRAENTGSMRAFERAGYRVTPDTVGGMRVLEVAQPVRPSPP